MTTGLDPIPDRAALRDRSAHQLRRAVRIGATTFTAIFVVLALALGLLVDEVRNLGFLLTMLAGLAAVGLLVLITVLVARRRARNPNLIWGTDSRTRRAVQRALRDGRAADPRTDALARETARESLHRTWYLPLAVSLAAMQLLVVAYSVSQAHWGDVPLRLSTLAIFVVIAAQQRREIRRARVYLREPRPAERPDTAA